METRSTMLSSSRTDSAATPLAETGSDAIPISRQLVWISPNRHGPSLRHKIVDAAFAAQPDLLAIRQTHVLTSGAHEPWLVPGLPVLAYLQQDASKIRRVCLSAAPAPLQGMLCSLLECSFPDAAASAHLGLAKKQPVSFCEAWHMSACSVFSGPDPAAEFEEEYSLVTLDDIDAEELSSFLCRVLGRAYAIRAETAHRRLEQIGQISGDLAMQARLALPHVKTRQTGLREAEADQAA